MNDCDQWTYYGMFACLLLLEGSRFDASLMATEAEGEGMYEEFEQGDMEMYLRAQQQRRVRRGRRRPSLTYVGGSALTLH